MKLNKIVTAVAVSFSLISAVHAADSTDQGHGTVTFTGTIIDAPCSISPKFIDQTVELGQISNVTLEDAGSSTPRSFSIPLNSCAK